MEVIPHGSYEDDRYERKRFFAIAGSHYSFLAYRNARRIKGCRVAVQDVPSSEYLHTCRASRSLVPNAARASYPYDVYPKASRKHQALPEIPSVDALSVGTTRPARLRFGYLQRIRSHQRRHYKG